MMITSELELLEFSKLLLEIWQVCPIEYNKSYCSICGHDITVNLKPTCGIEGCVRGSKFVYREDRVLDVSPVKYSTMLELGLEI